MYLLIASFGIDPVFVIKDWVFFWHQNCYKLWPVACEILAYVNEIEKVPLECNQDCENCPFVKSDKYFPKKETKSEDHLERSLEPKETPLPDILQLIEGNSKRGRTI